MKTLRYLAWALLLPMLFLFGCSANKSYVYTKHKVLYPPSAEEQQAQKTNNKENNCRPHAIPLWPIPQNTKTKLTKPHICIALTEGVEHMVSGPLSVPRDNTFWDWAQRGIAQAKDNTPLPRSYKRKDSTPPVAEDDKPERELPPKICKYAVLGFIFGIVGLFFFPILFSTLGIVYSIISLARINKHPEKYKGGGLAGAGLVMGVIGLAYGIYFLATYDPNSTSQLITFIASLII